MKLIDILKDAYEHGWSYVTIDRDFSVYYFSHKPNCKKKRWWWNFDTQNKMYFHNPNIKYPITCDSKHAIIRLSDLKINLKS